MKQLFKFVAECGEEVKVLVQPNEEKTEVLIKTWSEDVGVIRLNRREVSAFVGSLCDAADLKIKNQLNLFTNDNT